MSSTCKRYIIIQYVIVSGIIVSVAAAGRILQVSDLSASDG